jgi:hypothetical protein
MVHAAREAGQSLSKSKELLSIIETADSGLLLLQKVCWL